MECRVESLSVAESVASRLGKIERVVAVTVGGSCARGTAEKNSDLDLGIYYWSSKPPSVKLSDSSHAISTLTAAAAK